MPKDPAFLFYPGDWLTGTMILNRHQKGCYIDLLVAQFNNGPLSLEMVKTVLGQDQATWTILSSKFKQDSQGNFFNERLATEIEKRKEFIGSRKQNGKKGGRPPSKASEKPSGLHTVSLPEDINEDEIVKYTIEICLEISFKDERWVRANKTDRFELERFNEYMERLGQYTMNPLEYKRYFAKLKGKYPDMLKTELTMDQLRQLAKEQDKMNAA